MDKRWAPQQRQVRAKQLHRHTARLKLTNSTTNSAAYFVVAAVKAIQHFFPHFFGFLLFQKYLILLVKMAVESVNLRTFSNNTFSLKTGNKCFLCFTKLSKSSDKFDCLDSGSIFIKTEHLDADAIVHLNQPFKHSLWAIFRYLKLSPKQFLRQSLPNSDLKENDQLINQCRNFVVSLCENCGYIVEQLTKLCTELEVLQMKMNNKLQCFLD